MKKIAIGILYLFFMQTIVLAVNENNELKVRAAAFIHSSSLFRHIYKPADPCFEVEYVRCFADHVDGWINADWFWSRGHSLGLKLRTNINVLNFSLGIKYRKQFHECYSYYLGVGPSFGGVWLKNNTFCCRERISKHAVGAVFKTGVYRDFCHRGFVDFFADYLYQPIHFQKKVDVGGLKVGLGVGFKF